MRIGQEEGSNAPPVWVPLGYAGPSDSHKFLSSESSNFLPGVHRRIYLLAEAEMETKNGVSYVWYAVAIAMMVVLWTAFVYSIGNSESLECSKWKDQAGQYPGYYITQWQADQCSAHKVEINAPIK